jgi:hypothetical protein
MALGKVGGNQLETTLNIDSGTLYVDGTNNRVGIGTASPDQNLHIENTSASVRQRFVTSTTNQVSIDFGDTDSGTIGRITYDHYTDAMTFRANAADRLNIDSSGRVTMPYQPFFYAKTTGAGDGYTTNPFQFANVVHNVGNHFVTSGTGAYERFVAPVGGVYLFTTNAGYKQTSTNLQVRIAVNGSNFTDLFRLIGGNTSHSGGSGAALIKLAANDYVDVNPDSQTYHLNATFNYFSGILLG